MMYSLSSTHTQTRTTVSEECQGDINDYYITATIIVKFTIFDYFLGSFITLWITFGEIVFSFDFNICQKLCFSSYQMSLSL